MVIILILIDVFFNAKKILRTVSLSLSQSPHFLHYFIVCNLLQNEITFLRHPFHVSLSAKIHFSNVNFSKFETDNIEKYDLIVPLTIPDLEFCIKNMDKMPNNLIPFPSLESFNICNDKSQFEFFMLQNGFSSYLPLSKDEIKFPFILKKSQDEGGVNTFIVRDDNDLKTYQDQLIDPNYIKQSIVEGNREYATHIIIKDGKIKNALTIVYKFDDTVYIKGKDKYICRNICKSKHLEIFENILKTMDFNGLCCVNYKEKDGVPMILEINPRFGGSLCDYFYPFLQKLI
jgi:hypothetical protein